MMPDGLRMPGFLFGAVSASLATFAVESSAQARAGLESPLSHAVAEALRSPFHGDHLPHGLRESRLLLSATVHPSGVSSHAGPAASQTAPSPATDDARSLGEVFLLSTLASAAGILGTLYWHYSCEYGVSPPSSAGGGLVPEDHALCPEEEWIVLATGILATVTMTAVPAGLQRGFKSSLVGSSLGYAGGVLALFVIGASAIGEHFDITERVGMGFVAGLFSLTHAGITTLIAN